MSGERKGKQDSEGVLIELVSLIRTQATQTAARDERTFSQFDDLSSKMGVLAETVARSEQRHISGHDTMKRFAENVEKVVIAQNKDSGRITDLEKQVLLLEKSDEIVEKRWSNISGIAWKVISAIVVIVTLGYLGLK